MCVYLLPSLLAVLRRAPHLGTILMVNVLLGWTVVGWLYSLADAFSERGDEMHGELRLLSVPALQKAPVPKDPAFREQPDLPRAA